MPCCGNPRLLNDILRKQWGFQGFVVSDVGAVADIYLNHQVVPGAEEAAIMAVKAGCDLNGGTTYATLVGAVKRGAISESLIDQAVRRLMLARFRLGLFDPPEMVAYAQIPYTANDSLEHEQLAREVARQSMVLLQNDNHALPLKKNLQTIAVIGPTANNVSALVGNYSGTPSHPITILQGIRNAVPPATRVLYTGGSPLVTELLPLEEPLPPTCLFTDGSRLMRGLKADYYTDLGLAARPFRTRVDPNVDFDWTLQSPRDLMPVKDHFSACWNGVLVPPVSGTYQIGLSGAGAFRLYVDGECVVDDWAFRGRRSIGGRIKLQRQTPYSIRVEYFHGEEDAAVQLRWTRPDAEPFFAEAVRDARQADAVIMVLGLTAGLEREQETGGYEGFASGDRSTLDLPQVQEELLEAVCATGKPVTLVLTSGSGLAVNWAAAHVPAILEAWYPGEQGGDAVADVLFGDDNPAGRLPITFYKSVADLPPFADYSMQSRTYRYFHGQPLWPFGYGLSYTTFTYDDLNIAPAQPTTSQDLTVRVTVRNTGREAATKSYRCTRAAPAIPPPLPSAPSSASNASPSRAANPNKSNSPSPRTNSPSSTPTDTAKPSPAKSSSRSAPTPPTASRRTIKLEGPSAEPDYRYVPAPSSTPTTDRPLRSVPCSGKGP